MNSAVLVRSMSLVASVAIAAAVLLYFHDRVWRYLDDGAYLHVAERLLQGEVLHRDVQDIHAGYVNFANAAALWLFGNDVVSLRYPVVLMGVCCAALAFVLLADRGTPAAVTGSVAITCLSYVQFMNPSANWYAFFLFMMAIAVMTWVDAGHPRRPVILGLLIGLIFLFRQLSGVFAAIGVLTCLLMELPRGDRARDTWLAKALIVLMAAGLAGYLWLKADVVFGSLYGMWPLGILAWGWRYATARCGDVAGMLARFALGFAVAGAPLVAYHVYHGSVGVWLTDVFVAAESLTHLSFFDDMRYWMYVLDGADALARPTSLSYVLMGAFWLLAPLLPVLLGLIVVGTVWQRGRATSTTAARLPAPPLALLPVFYILVALHYQKYMYLAYGLPLTVLGLIVMTDQAKPAARRVVLALVLALSGLALVYGVGSFVWNVLPDRPVRLVRDHGLERCSIWLTEEQAEQYRQIQDLVRREVPPGEPIFALPFYPELYYLTARPNPTPFYLSALGLRSDQDVQALLRAFELSPPKLVFCNPDNAHMTARCQSVLRWVIDHYDHLGDYGGFDVYRIRASVD